MTVASSTNPARNDYTGNGSTTVYNFTFPVLKESNRADNKEYSIKVIITENTIDTVKTETTDYTVTLNEDTRLGTITFVTAPTATQKITFISDVDVSQATDYNNIGTGAFPADSHEKALDKLTILFRQFLENENRAVSLPASSNLSNLEIPVSSDNADKAIVINSTGDNLEAKNLADIGTAPVTDFIKTLIDDQTSEEARKTLSIDRRVTVDNANYTISATDKVVAQIGTMSATRTFSLPTASTVQAGAEIIVIDESGSVDSINKIIVQRDGTDTIDGATSEEIITAHGYLVLICDGANSWKVIKREVLDEDDLSSNSALKAATQQSIKAYIDGNPNFKATITSPQTLASGVFTKLQFDNEITDTKGWYDATTNYRFTPLRAGNYLVVAKVQLNNTSSTGDLVSQIHKNGFSHSQCTIASGASQPTNMHVAVITMNGSSDYLELYFRHSVGSNRDTYAGGLSEFSATYIGN